MAACEEFSLASDELVLREEDVASESNGRSAACVSPSEIARSSSASTELEFLSMEASGDACGSPSSSDGHRNLLSTHNSGDRIFKHERSTFIYETPSQQALIERRSDATGVSDKESDTEGEHASRPCLSIAEFLKNYQEEDDMAPRDRDTHPEEDDMAPPDHDAHPLGIVDSGTPTHIAPGRTASACTEMEFMDLRQEFGDW